MNAAVAIFTVGTQGDIRPCVALGLGLQRVGYRVRIVTDPSFAALVRANGLEFFPLTSDFQQFLDADRSIADKGLNLRQMARIFRDCYAGWAVDWVAQGRAAIEGAGLLIGVGNSTLLAKSLAEAHALPFVSMQLQPALMPSGILAPMVLAGSGRSLPPALNRALYHLLRLLVWRVMKPAINDIVRPQLGLPAHSWAGPYFDRGRELLNRVVYGFSRHVVPRPADWPHSAQIAGYWFLQEPQWQPSAALRDFLQAGPKPIYLGFGSMVSGDAGAFTETVLEGVRRSGQRAVLATGWGGLDGAEGARDENTFFIRSAPHDWLFPRMAAAVHHGGAGTTAAAARAGIPSVIVPFYGDQPFWARCLHNQGTAPAALDRKRMQPDDLAAALAQTARPSMQEAAQRLGRRVQAEDGVGEAIRCLRDWGLLHDSTQQLPARRDAA